MENAEKIFNFMEENSGESYTIFFLSQYFNIDLKTLAKILYAGIGWDLIDYSRTKVDGEDIILFKYKDRK